MFKSKLSLSLIITMSFMTSVAFSQSTSQPALFPSPATKMNNSPPALSADDFKAAVVQKNQKAQADLLKEGQKNIKEQASQITSPLGGPPGKASTSSSSSTSSEEATPTQKKSTPENTEEKETPATSSEQQTSQNTAPVVTPVAPTPVPKTSTPAATPQQNQTYTGFGAGNTTNTPTTPKNSQSGGGWNIKY